MLRNIVSAVPPIELLRQFCRLAFDLVDADGRIIVADRHLLSLRDMNRTSSLEEMMDAGVRSFKIEGRLKDVSYVKNVTAWYRQEIDKIIRRRPETYRRASFGTSQLTFTPMPRAVSTADSPTTFAWSHSSPCTFLCHPQGRRSGVGQVQRVRRQVSNVSFPPYPSRQPRLSAAMDYASWEQTANCKVLESTKSKAMKYSRTACLVYL